MATIGLLLVGGATAAVMSRSDAPVQTATIDEQTVKQLFDTINSLQHERVELLRKIQGMLETHKVDATQIDDLKQTLQQKDTQIQELIDKVQAIKIQSAPKAAPPSQATLVLDQIETARHDLEGCYDEWSSRPMSTADIGKNVAAPSDSYAIVELNVSPDGIASNAKASGQDAKNSPSLKFCIEGAVSRVHYPKGPEILDVKVDVAWTDGNVNMSARVVGHHEAPKTDIDL
jgi:hypothetical protein